MFTPLIARTVRAAVLLERDLDYVSAARLRGESSLYIMFVEILPNVIGADRRRVHRPPRLRRVHDRDAVVPGLRAPAAVAELGRRTSPPTTAWSTAGYWWEVLFDALAIASLVIGVNMIANSIEATLDDS